MDNGHDKVSQKKCLEEMLKERKQCIIDFMEACHLNTSELINEPALAKAYGKAKQEYDLIYDLLQLYKHE